MHRPTTPVQMIITGRIDRIARQDGDVVAACNHHREDQRGLNDCDCDRKHQRAEWLADAMGDTSAWWTAAITPDESDAAQRRKQRSAPAMPATTSRPNDNAGISQVQVGMIHPHSNRRDSPLAEG